MALGKLADKYGSIFMIKLGVHRAVAVSTAEMAKECLGASDRVFLNRPHKIFVKLSLIVYNISFINSCLKL